MPGLDSVSFRLLRAGRQGPPTRTIPGVPTAAGSQTESVESLQMLLRKTKITQKCDNSQQTCSCGVQR